MNVKIQHMVFLAVFIVAFVSAVLYFFSNMSIVGFRFWTTVVSASSSVLVFLAAPFSFNVIWRLFKRLNSWVVPNLNGVYKVTNYSNWSAVDPCSSLERGHTLSRGQLSQFNGELELKMGALTISGTYKPEPSNANPSPTFSNIISGRVYNDNGRYFLVYTYEAETEAGHVAVDTDEKGHLGTARLEITDIDQWPKLKLDGNYWTNRSWDKGLNTSGQVKLSLK